MFLLLSSVSLSSCQVFKKPNFRLRRVPALQLWASKLGVKNCRLAPVEFEMFIIGVLTCELEIILILLRCLCQRGWNILFLFLVVAGPPAHHNSQ